MSKAYYNEIDPFAAAWLRNLISAGHIAVGDVDERSIEDVKPSDLLGYTQCHFFAGIGGWSYALRLARWPDDRPCWTGSCPCQPYSQPGKKLGFADERHLWPSWFHLIRVRKPITIFGEQVANKAALPWFDLVSSDLEGENYTVGAADLCAASVGAPHKRQRLFFAAHSKLQRDSGLCISPSIGPSRPWGSFGPLDLQSILDSPFISGNGFPQPLIRKMDDGFNTRMGRISAYGNAIIPQVAATFIQAYLESTENGQVRRFPS